jgi:nucleotide-binding universal stress UspA family protein
MALASRILAPVDFSAPSRAAACYAAALAVRTGSRLHVMHTVTPAPAILDFSMVDASDQVLKGLLETRERRALEYLERMDLPGSHIRRTLAEGEPATEILKAAEAEHSDMIVMSTHGANTVQRVFGVGSVTLRVLGGATCPVLTGVKFSEPAAVSHGNIVCALDLGATATRTLEWAGQAAREFDARLVVVHATTLREKKLAGFVEDGWYQNLAARLTKHFRDLMDAANLHGDVVIDDGSPHEVVAKAASTQNAGWVVIGRSASQGVMDRLRANSYDIVRRSPCPVVSV